MADVCRPGDHGFDGSVNVDGYRARAPVMSGDGRVLRRDGEVIPRYGQFLLLCRTIVSQSRRALEIRAPSQVHCRLGFAFVLLDLSRRDGWIHGSSLRLSRGNHLANFMNASNPGPV